MSDGRDVVYMYDGSFDGFLTAVFDAVYARKNPVDIVDWNGSVQSQLYCDYIYADTDLEKARRVYDSIAKKISYTARYNVFCVFLSDTEGREKLLFDYLQYGYRLGKNVDAYLTIDTIRKVADTAKRVGNEAHMHKEFIRFAELKNGAYYAEISPKNNILPMLSGHFLERFPSMPWMIHDLTYKQCMVYDGKQCRIEYVQSEPVIEYSDAEIKYRNLWKLFYDTIEIKERHNEKCRMNFMPKRYWKHLVEMK